ncbi:hypothetical protein DR73_544 [Enterobacteriaceae bacterium ATCC 29904]|nr:hypothetical protein DR73_544 [Enterobacteriaceae bacterium ATCC 29904]
MATQPTNLPVPSESPRDLKFNAGKIDEFVTSVVNTYVDRFGHEHYTIEGLRELALKAISSLGWSPAGSFQSGANLIVPNQIIKDENSGAYYRWDGVFPKLVASGSKPESTGGTGPGAWLLISSMGFDVITTEILKQGNFGVDTMVCLSDRDNALFKIVSGGVSNGMDILEAGDGTTAQLIIERSSSIKSIGALQNDVEIDETVYVKRWSEICPGTIEFGNCSTGFIDFSGRNTLRIKLTGDVKITPTTESVVWKFSSDDLLTNLVDIDLNGFTIDCNYKNQPVWNGLMITNNTSVLKVSNGGIKNINHYGIGGTLSTYDLLQVRNVNFTEGRLHNGELGDSQRSCRFIGVYGGKLTDVQHCIFKQLTLPLDSQNRNPSGVFISGGNGEKDVIVTDCEFDNLGNLIGVNLESPLDLYSHARSVTYARNKFTRSRYVAFRATNAEQAIITDNEVIQDVPIKYDGGSIYADATCLSIGIVDRGYQLNKVDNLIYEIKNNQFKILSAAGDCRAVIGGSDSTTHIVHKMSFNNNYYFGVNTNNFEAVFIDSILHADFDDISVYGFTNQYRIQRTELPGAIMTSRGRPNSSTYNIRTKTFSDANIGVFSRVQVSNMSIRVDDVNMKGLTVPFSIRNANIVRIMNNILGATSAGEARSNVALYHINNSVPSGTDPVDYSTNTYYRLMDNIGRHDVTSPPYP